MTDRNLQLLFCQTTKLQRAEILSVSGRQTNGGNQPEQDKTTHLRVYFSTINTGSQQQQLLQRSEEPLKLRPVPSRPDCGVVQTRCQRRFSSGEFVSMHDSVCF